MAILHVRLPDGWVRRAGLVYAQAKSILKIDLVSSSILVLALVYAWAKFVARPDLSYEESAARFLLLGTAGLVLFIGYAWVRCTGRLGLKPRLVTSGLVLLSICCAKVSALSFEYQITTDKAAYKVGEQVHWTLSASVSSDNDGIEGFTVKINENKHEKMNSPFIAKLLAAPKTYKYFYVSEGYHNTGLGSTGIYFSKENGFEALGPDVNNISVSQYKGFQNKYGGTVCEGVYTVTKTGLHILDPNHVGGSVYGFSGDVTDSSSYNASFYVTSNINANISAISSAALAVFVPYYDQACNAENNYCDGTDLNSDGTVNDLDVAEALVQMGVDLDVVADVYQFNRATAPPQFLEIPDPHSPQCAAVGADVYVAVTDPNCGTELLRYRQGKGQVIDVLAGPRSSATQNLTAFKGSLYFVARSSQDTWGLYKLSGDTPVLVKDGLCESDAKNLISLTVFQNALYFTAVAGGFRSLWRTVDGAQCEQVSNLGLEMEAPAHFAADAKTMVFATRVDQDLHSVCSWNGSEVQVLAATGSNPPARITLNRGQVFYLDGRDLCAVAAAGGPSQRLAYGVQADQTPPFAVMDQWVYYSVLDEWGRLTIAKTDGTPTGTQEVQEVPGPLGPTPQVSIAACNGQVYFALNQGSSESQLWQVGCPEPLARFKSDGVSELKDLTSLMGQLFFVETGVAIHKVFHGQVMQVPAAGESGPQTPCALVRCGDRLVVTCDEPSADPLWIFGLADEAQ